MNRCLSIIFLAILVAVFFLGCSSSGTNPLVPGQGAGLTEATVNGTAASQTHLWGYYDVTIDPETWEVSAADNRSAMFTVNVVNFLNKKPLCLKFKINQVINGSDYIDIDINIGLTHPFPGMPQYNGYDVRGIFMGDGSASLAYNSDLIYPMPGTDQYMLADTVDGYGGPDGYTRWFNLSEFSGGGMPLFQYTQGKAASPNFAGTATLNPYKYFADGLGLNDNLWTWINAHAGQRGQFSSGASNERNYYLRFPNGKGIKYGYAVIANWEGVLPDEHPSNAPEAVALRVIDSSDAWFVSPTEFGGNIDLDISVFDWDSALSAGVMEDYKIFIDSTVLSAPYEADTSDMTPVGGDENYSTYQLEIPATNIGQLDGNELWVIVECRNSDYANPFGIMNNAWEDKLAAFFRYDFEVSNQKPCDFTLDHMNPDTADITDSLQDVQIIGGGFTDGIDLSCYLSNGSIDITGENVEFIDSQTVQADFDFALAGAEIGTYDLYYTNGDGCESVLIDAFTLTSVNWPVLIDGEEKYCYSGFIKDSKGIFHVFAGYQAVSGTPGTWELRWFFSKNSGQTWTFGGDIYVNSGLPGYTASTGHTACAADAKGGVYVAYSEKGVTIYNPQPVRLAYLNTAAHPDPSQWDPSDWQTKNCINIDRLSHAHYLAVSPDGAIFAYGMRYSPSQCFYNYAASYADMDWSTTKILTGSNGVTNMSFQHVYLTETNGCIYNPTDGHFYLIQAGNFTPGSQYGSCQNTGGYILKFNPAGGSSAWSMFTYFDHPAYQLAGELVRINWGDLALDSAGKFHWVHAYRHPTTAYPYSEATLQHKFIYGTNKSGSWIYTDPITSNYTFPPTPPNDPANLLKYEARALNLVVNDNDKCILTWMQALNYQNLWGANNSSGSWSAAPNSLDQDGLRVFSPRGEAHGDKAAIVFTTLNFPAGLYGALYFTMTGG